MIVGMLSLLSAAVINPWLGAYYRTPIVNYRDVLFIYMWCSLGLSAGLFLTGVVLRRLTSEPAVKVGLLIVSVTIVVLADRLLLVVFGLPYWVPDPVIHYRHRPNTIRSWWKGNPTTTQAEHFLDKNLVINEHGFHDHSFPVAKPQGELRGLFLGDSVTMGHGVTRDEIFANQLEELMKNHGTSHGSYQFINAGVQGYSTFQELHTLRGALRFDPDFVVVGFCLNDITEPYWIDKRLGGTGWYYQVSQVSNSFLGYLLNETGFGRLIRRNRERSFKSEQTTQRYADYDVRKMSAASVGDSRFAAGWKLVLDDLEMIYKLARQHKIPVFLLIFPYTFQLTQDGYNNPQLILKAHAQRYGVGCIDFVSEFEAFLRQDMQRFFREVDRPLPAPSNHREFFSLQLHRYFLDEDHFNEAGHRIVAERLAEYLCDQQLVILDEESFATAKEESRQDYDQLIMKIPRKFEEIVKMTRSLEKFGMVGPVERTYRHAIGKSADHRSKAGFAFLLGNFYLRNGYHDKSFVFYRQSAGFDPEFAAARVGLGTVLRKLGKHDEAKQQYQAAAELHSSDPQLFHAIGRALIDLNDPQGAKLAFEKAVSLDSSRSEAY